MFNNKNILITGGTGSFGNKFTEQVFKKFRPKKLVIYSRDELKQSLMAKKFTSSRIRFFIGDVLGSITFIIFLMILFNLLQQRRMYKVHED